MADPKGDSSIRAENLSLPCPLSVTCCVATPFACKIQDKEGFSRDHRNKYARKLLRVEYIYVLGYVKFNTYSLVKRKDACSCSSYMVLACVHRNYDLESASMHACMKGSFTPWTEL